MSVIQAIETVYKNYRFRSRLEARWAVFFDALGIEWEYEPEGYVLEDGTWYLPDFWLPKWGVFAEVKPSPFDLADYAKAAGLPHLCIALDGMPELRWYQVIGQNDEEVGGGNVPAAWRLYSKGGNHWTRIDLCMSAYKGRLWYDYGQGSVIDDGYTKAIAAARSARFEHGEAPNV